MSKSRSWWHLKLEPLARRNGWFLAVAADHSLFWTSRCSKALRFDSAAAAKKFAAPRLSGGAAPVEVVEA